MTHPLLTRAHLEALVLARVLLDPVLAERVDEARLSPAALTLLDFVCDNPTHAAVTMHGGVVDEYTARLADRVERLTFAELRFYRDADALLALVNTLPVLQARPVRSEAA